MYGSYSGFNTRASSPEWNEELREGLLSVFDSLGKPTRENVRAELYKLLLYEEGAFFKPHQDSEKTPGMFGTLVVCLPSVHEGGRIVLSHNKQKYVFDSSTSSDFDTSCAAWYADVFHEVEPVISGYRLVLTYNLVQRGSHLPQNAPDGDAKSKVIKIPKEFEEDAAEYKEYASFAAYKLEHYYTQESLGMSSLKGKDYQIVQLLRDACNSGDFDIYLATFEKEVDRDDDTGSEIYNHSESFTHVTSLDGAVQELAFDYNKGCITWDREAEAEGDADESEHEGYTGNEGAPATFWYRDTVVIIVPPSRKVDTVFNSSGQSLKLAMDMMDRLLHEAQENTLKQNQLLRICQLLLPKVAFNRTSAWSWSNAPPQSDKEALQCRERVIIAALQLENLDLFTQAASSFEFTNKVLNKFGEALEKLGLTYWTPAVIQLLDAAVSIAKKWQILKAIIGCLKKTTSGEGPAFEEWTQEMLNLILKTTERPRKADGETFAELALHPYIDAEKHIVPRMLDTDAMVVGGFVIKYHRSVGGKFEAGQAHLLDMLIHHLWDDFEFFSAVEVPPRADNYVVPLRTSLRNTTEIDGFICDELIALVVVSLNRSGCTTKSIFEKLAGATLSLTAEYLDETVIPFVKALVSRTIPDVNYEDESMRDFVRLVLVQYIHKFVQNEPLRPDHWAMPASEKSCICGNCKKVHAFLASRTQKQLNISDNQKNRSHLQSYWGYPHKGASYKTDTIKDSIPHTWRVTKNHEPFNQEHRKWAARHKEAEKTMLKLGGGKGLPNLKPWLGEQFKQITSCKVEMLPPSGEFPAEQRQPLQESDGNAAERKNNGKKRKAGGDAENNTPAKKVASERVGAVEVIDLT